MGESIPISSLRSVILSFENFSTGLRPETKKPTIKRARTHNHTQGNTESRCCCRGTRRGTHRDRKPAGSGCCWPRNRRAAPVYLHLPPTSPSDPQRHFLSFYRRPHPKHQGTIPTHCRKDPSGPELPLLREMLRREPTDPHRSRLIRDEARLSPMDRTVDPSPWPQIPIEPLWAG